MKAGRFEKLVLSEAERAAFLSRVHPAVSADDYQRIAAMARALPELLAAAEDPAALRKLQHLLFGPKSEAKGRVCPPTAPAPIGPPKRKRRGHGRTKAGDYTGARRVHVPHPGLNAGQRCPGCGRGTLRAQPPAQALRIEGSPPIAATVYALERLRCDTCGAVSTAPAPPQAGEKYAPNVAVMIALLRYGAGMPHHRLARLQQSLGVPLPESTQWELIAPLGELVRPVFAELVAQAANAPLIHQDDTTMRILDLRRPGSAAAAQFDPKRKGTFTSNLLAEVQDHPIALYFTGWKHAGENLAEVLRQRAADLAPPIQMCDALSRNTSPGAETVLAFCLCHGRREFITAAPSFPDECRHVLEAIGEVYRFDAQAKELDLPPDARLAYHQSNSQPVMAGLKIWMQEKIDGRHVEPNSGLGQAIGYMLRHWEPLTLFLRKPAAPLDNNRCEQALKMAILHRKNSLSYKTLNGARTGDLFMSLIHTCRLGHVNPFDYLLALATNPAAVQARPAAWLPWNYRADQSALAPDPPGLA